MNRCDLNTRENICLLHKNFTVYPYDRKQEMNADRTNKQTALSRPGVWVLSIFVSALCKSVHIVKISSLYYSLKENNELAFENVLW